MENFLSKIMENVGGFLIITFLPLLILLPIAKAKYRLKLLWIALGFALLIEFSSFLFRNSPVSPTSWNDLFIWHFSRGTIVFLPIIFFALVLLSLAENKKQVLEITLGYLLVILSALFLGGNMSTMLIPLILAPALFITLMRKVKRRLALSIFYLVLVAIFSFFYASNIWIMGTADFRREIANRHGYTDVELFERHQKELGMKEDLENMRKVIENYRRENEVFPPTINDEIFSTYCCWFTLENIPGKDNKVLIEYLERECKINWVKIPKIKKNNEDQSITVTDGKNLIVLKLSKEYDHIVNIELNGKVIEEEYRAKKGGKIRIGAKHNEVPSANLADHPNIEKVIVVKTKFNQNIQPSQITDEGGWIYSSASGDIRINCTHKDSKGIYYYEY